MYAVSHIIYIATVTSLWSLSLIPDQYIAYLFTVACTEADRASNE